MFGVLGKFFDSNDKVLKELSKTVEKINSLEEKYTKLTDVKLLEKGQEFKKNISSGKSLDEILPDVYAAIREASKRKTERRLFDVQLIAAIAFHQGKISEQKTGEGKTLSAVPALFLNSLTGAGVH